MTELPTLAIREWSRVTPAEAELLCGLRLSRADREWLDSLAERTSLRVEELRQGLRVEIGPHIGTLTLSCLRIVALPKLRLDTLMGMIAYAFDLSDLILSPTLSGSAATEQGFIDLLGLSLLQAVERIVCGGLQPRYFYRQEELASPRGRIDMRHTATRPRRPRLRCGYFELTVDHPLNRALAAGLRLAAGIVQDAELRLRLAHGADRQFPELPPLHLDGKLLAAARACLDRRSRHYEPALTLIALLVQGSHPAPYDLTGRIPLSGFLLDMNRLFERFLSRYLQRHAPRDIEVISQDVRSDAFAYLENPHGWRSPAIRPDLVFLRRGQTVAIADAKYRNHHEHPPSAAELYQLTTYALAYPMPAPREVYLFYPLPVDGAMRPVRLQFAPDGVESVWVRLVGVPVDSLLSKPCSGWWPITLS